jgi:sulfatase maturation enzyme AslB (radical SAM superfamily)
LDTIEQNPDWAEIIRNAKQFTARALQTGDYAAGRAMALKILAAAPADPEALLLMAQSDSVSGNTAIARALLARASALAPQAEVLRYQKNQLDILDDQAAADPYTLNYLRGRAMFMEYPMNIQLETVGRCNANCTFCPHEQLDRKYEEMSDALFAKIIDEAATIPRDNPLNFYLNVINEPFMDKKIFERIQMINEKVPHATIGFYTNLNVLPRDFFAKMRKAQRITSFNVSFNAANREEYEASMRIDFDRTVANLRGFLAANREHKMVPAPICLSRIATLDERDQRFIPECDALFEGFQSGVDYAPTVKRRANWLGEVSSDQTSVPLRSPCMQWLNISVFCDGTVPHCCMDATGKYGFGNVNEHSLLEIYNSPKFRVMREAVLGRGAIHPCNTCALA